MTGLREAIEALADSIQGDSDVEHNEGCEGEPDCLACIIADLRAALAAHPAPPATVVEEYVEWGVALASDPNSFLGVRYNPSFGGARDPEPYTEAEARADAKAHGLALVRRTRTVTPDVVTEWEEVQ